LKKSLFRNISIFTTGTAATAVDAMAIHLLDVALGDLGEGRGDLESPMALPVRLPEFALGLVNDQFNGIQLWTVRG
jgi:hypothetical protein